MINISIIVSVVVFGFLLGQMTSIAFVKSIRNDNKNRMTINQVIAICSFLGGPAMLISYLFPEIRDEDSVNHRLWIIVAIISTLLEIIIIVLLFVFDVVKY